MWAWLCGLPVGAAIGLALLPAPSPAALAGAALAGGVALAALVSVLARRDDDPERGHHLAAAASLGWLGALATVAVQLAWAPGPIAWIALLVVVLALALLRGARDPGPAAGPPGWIARALVALAAGSLAVLALAAAGAALVAAPIEPSARFASVLYAIDAGVVTRPFPVCDATPLAVEPLPAHGVNPSLAPDGRHVFFDAPAASDGGRRQIHRFDRETGELRCWTCGDPGNNVRPTVNSAGVSLLFESDRDATWQRPDESELYLAAVAKREDAADPGRRLSFLPGPDTHPVFGPGPQMVTWSRREDGRAQVVSATIRTGHGGILLGTVGRLADGGAEWIAPVAWGVDGRSLVVVRGNPFAALEGFVLDPATGAERALGTGVGPAAAANGDAAWLAFATTRSHHRAGVVPRVLGFLLAPFAAERSRHAPLRSETGLRVGPIERPEQAVALALPDAVARWGEPVGLALAPDASAIVLGQRRAAGGLVEERLVEVRLACTQLADTPRGAPGASSP
jgi:hypothetical protein